MRDPILYFLILVLRIPLNLDLDVGHKRGEFSETLSEKDFEFIPSEGGGLVALNLGFVLLPGEDNSIPKVTRLQKEHVGAPWHRQYQNSPNTVDRSSSTSCENYYSIVQDSGP